jgi:hypothetical protein
MNKRAVATFQKILYYWVGKNECNYVMKLD